MKPKTLFFLSLGVVGYFCLLCLNAYVIKSDLAMIGVLQELLTLPVIIIQAVFFVFSVKYCIRDRFRLKTYSFWTFIILLAGISFSAGSIVVAKI